jgi:hypothetical protein
VDFRILALLVLIGIVIYWAGEAFWKPPAPSPPEITFVEFPDQIPADGEEVLGTVGFQDPDGDIVEVRFEVVEALLFEPFRFDPQVRGQREGEFDFVVFSSIPQQVALRVILVDQAGNESLPVEFTFEAVDGF